jgi:peptidoglycan/xylan/chitin deacetylase (PgdA/CDA1 family)
LRSVLGDVRRQVLRAVHRRLKCLEDQGPVVSFCFDDFPRTALTTGGSILKSFGVRATYYAAMGLSNTSGELGDAFTTNDLYSLVSDGHELATHTFSHISCRRVSASLFRQDVQRGRDAICDLGLVPSDNFAYPFGEVTINAKGVIGQEMASCRGTQSGINGPVMDLNLLRANCLYGGSGKLDAADALLSCNREQSGWLIFYTHDVRENPSRYGCTPGLLEEVVSRSLEIGCRVATVAEVLAGSDHQREEAQKGNAPLAQVH